jgi:hypothetical protein
MLKNYKAWFGLFRNAELIAVQAFDFEPSIMDFKMPYFSDNDYEVREVEIKW